MKEVQLFLARGPLVRGTRPFVYSMAVSPEEALRLIEKAPWSVFVHGSPFLVVIQPIETGRRRTSLVWERIAEEFMFDDHLFSSRLIVRGAHVPE